MTARTSRRDRRWRLLRSERGAALVVTLLGLVALTILGVGITAVGMVATTVTRNEQEMAEALAIADAGISHAKKLILWQEWSTLNQFLQNGAGTACDGDELAGPPAAPLPPGYPTALSDFIPKAGRAFGNGTYQVSVCDDHLTDVDLVTAVLDTNPDVDVNKRILIRSVGTGPNGATATIELVLASHDLPAVIVNGDLVVPGAPRIQGLGGAVHANGTLTIEGNPCAQQFYSAVETVPVMGTSAGTGTSCSNTDLDTRPDSAPLTVPFMSPDTYKAVADYWLESNGKVYNPATGLEFPAGAVPGWTFSAMTWTGASNIPGGTYWINGNVVIGGSPGSPSSPLPLTLLSKLSIDIAGSPRTIPDLIITGPGMTAPVGVSAIAGTDLQLAGNTSQLFTGVYYAQHQLNVAGTPTINGQLLGANLADTPYLPNLTNKVMLDATGRMVITGSPTVNFNGAGIVGTRPVAWRECRTDTNPNNPCGALWGGNP